MTELIESANALPKPKVIVNPEHQMAPIVADLSHNMIILSQEFNQLTKDMPGIISNAKKVLGLEDEIKLNLDAMTDEEVEQALETLEGPMEHWREFSSNRTQVNRQLTNFSNIFKTSIEEVAKVAGFDELDTLRDEGLRIQKEIRSNRQRKRWLEAYEIYESALSAYPQVEQVFPSLTQQDSFERIVTNFNLFKVTGAKSFKITSTIKTAIADLAARLGNLATATLHELSQLPSEVHSTIIRTLISQPDTETLYKQVQLQRTSLAAKAQEAQLRQAQQAQQAQPGQQTVQAQPNQPVNMPFAQPGTIATGYPITLTTPITDNGEFYESARNWLLKVYLPQYGNLFYDALTNPVSKLNLIIQITTQMQDPTSSVSQILNGNSEAGLTLLLAAHSL